MKTTISIFFFTAFTVSTFCQSKFIDKFTLRQSFQSKNDKAEPAVFTFTKPKDKDESWLLNAAIGYNLLSSKKSVLTLDPYFEYYKNTLIDKIQDNWQAGISSEWQSSDLSQKKWSPIFIAAMKYNEDKIKKNTSFQGNVYFTPLFKGKAKDPKYFWIPNNTSDFGKIFQFSYSPYFGFENENRLKTERDSSLGNIYRAVFRVTSTITFFPKSEKFKGKFEFNIDWQYRNNFSVSVKDLSQKEHIFLTTSLNYTFFSTEDGKKAAKIGFDFTNGENPAKNFEKQSFYAASLKIKL
ncbi:hypothetical protein [Haliscomenobacter hydrossis]|uniref:Uncharacterized protein n=1 Tax=Haliscomenobacter hydrossis (strain ATCC 27775 / DSM 1100 / LMG 10767 / O) TaxID=760192 RepID=F4L6B6_HALH1|nr:hypothetical protein [Haliscomenobacter hydrossis]AEE48798.1 hypothetical protein Halhy_0897 [Haliscomenobacter hydrossis DSM 1100]